ncbi:MAG: hypothetical protein JWQ02_2114 [Capsulimonas sp.]|nr:hypothetical protein [Capsulimonas sp.]
MGLCSFLHYGILAWTAVTNAPFPARRALLGKGEAEVYFGGGIGLYTPEKLSKIASPTNPDFSG